ncbi:MAG: hypothetical protein A3E83_07890 [Gammaproteobacteria bacterium RIFCSPHIGHO2_12_FULL_41_20]|nr:MAG: hypothetical protein A3E83_07890 [Gammaproteobacteria bacterium RIFCSPHIGHO2_12_FULL_41_20]
MKLLSFTLFNYHFYFVLNVQRLYVFIALTIFFLLSVTILAWNKQRKQKNKHTIFVSSPNKSSSLVISSKDITAIAGEDKIATQLDLARAYIEAGREQLAKKMLRHVVEKGSPGQQQEAERLLLLF